MYCFVQDDSRAKRHYKGKKRQDFCIISLRWMNGDGYLETVCSLKHPKYSPTVIFQKVGLFQQTPSLYVVQRLTPVQPMPSFHQLKTLVVFESIGKI